MKNKKYIITSIIIILISTIIILLKNNGLNSKQVKKWWQQEINTKQQEQWYKNIRIYTDLKDLYQNLLNSWMNCYQPKKEFDPYICEWTWYKTVYEIPKLNISFTHNYYVFFSGIENDYRVLFKNKPLNFFISWNALYYIDSTMIISWDTLLWSDWLEPYGAPLQDQNTAKKYWKKILEKLYFNWKISAALDNIKKNIGEEISILYENIPRMKPDTLFLKNDELNNFLYQIWVNHKENWLDCYKSWLYVACFKSWYNYYYLIHTPTPNENLSPINNLTLFN